MRIYCTAVAPFHLLVETLRRYRAMSKDTGELIIKKIHKFMLSAFFQLYISSLIIAPNAPFSQGLSHMFSVEI